MTIRVNGEPLEIAGPVTVSALQADLKIDFRRDGQQHTTEVTLKPRKELESR